VIWTPLDNKTKNIPGGTKAKPFKVTEFAHYAYIQKVIKRTQIGITAAYKSFTDGTLDIFKDPDAFTKAEKHIKYLKSQCERMVFARTRFIYNLTSKTVIAERALKAMEGQGKRTLVFCGSIAQANHLLKERVYHSKSGNDAFTAFNAKLIDTLGVVNAANEGINFIDLDQSLVLQVDSNARNLVQRIGRNLRVREGHKAVIYIVCVPDTVDQKWLELSLEGFDHSKISYYFAKDIQG
jgi:superfamily II DNA or RNA helicase